MLIYFQEIIIDMNKDLKIRMLIVVFWKNEIEFKYLK